MIRIVLDTNLFVSALLKPGSNADLIFHAVKDERVLLLLSDDICHEISRGLTYPKIRKRLKASDQEIEQFLQLFGMVAVITPGLLKLPPLEADPDDTKYLVCAVEGRADFIVSGDHHLTDLLSYRGIRIVNPADFMQILSMNN